MDNDLRREKLRKICEEVIGFKQSPLYKERIKNKAFPVFGEGSHSAKIMFIGEAPGRTEAETGRPFCGAAGRILDELLASISMPRSEVYITNIVKDRPTDNRDPSLEEIALYAPFLDRQVEIIQPKIIALLGRHSMGYIMDKYGLNTELKSISAIHGKIFETETSFGKIKIIPLYHPAVALYNASQKSTLIADFQTLKKELEF